jgi:hypothetical protein
LVLEYRRSGLTQRRFCQKHNLCLSTLTLWLRREGKEKAGAPLRLIPAEVSPNDFSAERLDIVLSNGRVIRVPAHASPQSILPWIQTLERPCGV